MSNWAVLKYNHLLSTVRVVPEDPALSTDQQLGFKIFISLIDILRHNAAQQSGRYPSSRKTQNETPTLLDYRIKVYCVRQRLTARLTIGDISIENADPRRAFSSVELSRLLEILRRQVPGLPPNMEIWAGADRDSVAKTDVELQDMLNDCWYEGQDPLHLFTR